MLHHSSKTTISCDFVDPFITIQLFLLLALLTTLPFQLKVPRYILGNVIIGRTAMFTPKLSRSHRLLVCLAKLVDLVLFIQFRVIMAVAMQDPTLIEA